LRNENPLCVGLDIKSTTIVAFPNTFYIRIAASKATLLASVGAKELAASLTFSSRSPPTGASTSDPPSFPVNPR
jgi:hypothetical protein